MTCYAIKHLPSGGYLPQRERRGHTFEEPHVGRIPRLFAREQYARLALKAWLKGAWEPDYETDDCFRIGASAPSDPPETRKPEEMAVVKIALRGL